MNSITRITALLGATLALAACGTTATPSTTLQASATTEPASQPSDVPAVVCAIAPKPFDPSDIDLTGAWAGANGGILYLRQLGSVVWWNGMSEREGSPLHLGREWNNVGRGVIDGLHIVAEHADVPRGEALEHGTQISNIEDDGKGNIQLVELSVVEGYSDHVWTPCWPVEQQVAAYVEAYGGDPSQYADILTSDACDGLADLEDAVTTTLDTADAGSPEFRAALGYSNAIDERQLVLDC